MKTYPLNHKCIHLDSNELHQNSIWLLVKGSIPIHQMTICNKYFHLDIQIHDQDTGHFPMILVSLLNEMLQSVYWPLCSLLIKTIETTRNKFYKNKMLKIHLSLHPCVTDRVGPLPTGKFGRKFVPSEKNTLKFHPHWKTKLNTEHIQILGTPTGF